MKFFFLFLLFFLPFSSVFAEISYEKGTILNVEKNEKTITYELETAQKKKISVTENSDVFRAKTFEKGDEVLFSEEKTDGEKIFIIQDSYRLDGLFFITLIFFTFVLIFTRGKGLGAAAGLLFSFVFLFWGVVPLLSKGYPPLLIALISAIILSTTSMYLAHGFSKKTTFSIISILITLCFVFIFSMVGMHFLHLFGLGNEAATLLSMDENFSFDFKGILLTGIVLGTLGILDDVVSVQSAVIFSLVEENKNLSFSELFWKGISVGNEHIFSMINTLFLVYFGASLPLVMMLFVGESNMTVFLNSESMIEEIFTTWAGSLGILFAVPISSFFAAWHAKLIAKK